LKKKNKVFEQPLFFLLLTNTLGAFDARAVHFPTIVSTVWLRAKGVSDFSTLRFLK